MSDKPRQIVGVDPETIPDEADWANRLREDFEPEIVISTKFYEVRGLPLFVVGVNVSPHRPVICRRSVPKEIVDRGKRKQTEVLRDGAIYFRYAGQTRLIKYTELSSMLEEREREKLRILMQTMRIVEQVGVERVGVVDRTAGAVTNVLISREAAKDLSFVDRARIVKDKGAPAYVVLGQAQLSHVVHVPIDEADRNLPKEAAHQLTPLAVELYGMVREGKGLTPHQTLMLMSHLNLKHDERYYFEDKKMGRKYITRQGIAAIEKFLRERPLEALKVFGSRKAISDYEQLRRA